MSGLRSGRRCATGLVVAVVIVVTHMVRQQFAYAEQRAVFASVRAEFLPARCRVSNPSLTLSLHLALSV